MKLPKTFRPKGIPLQVVSISMHKVNCAYMIFVLECFLLNCVSVVYLLAICSQALLNIESNRRGPEFAVGGVTGRWLAANTGRS